MPRVILDGQLCRLVPADHGIKADRDADIFARLIGRARRREQLPVLLRLLPDAEHIRAGLSLIIALREALTGEYRLQLTQIFLRDALSIQRGAVGLRHHGHIFRPLHAALDLQRADAEAAQIVQIFHKAVVLEAQRIAVRLKPAVAVGQAARLGTLPAVAASSSDHGRKIALSGIAHAERAVDKHLDLDRASPADMRDLLAGKLP